MELPDEDIPLAVLHTPDGVLVVLEVDETGQLVETRVAPDGSTTVDVVPRLQ